MGVFDSLFQGNLLGNLGGASGLLTKQQGILQSRLNAVRAGASIQDKVSALSGTLGMRVGSLKSLAGGLGGSSSSSSSSSGSSASTHAAFQNYPSYYSAAQRAESQPASTVVAQFR